MTELDEKLAGKVKSWMDRSSLPQSGWAERLGISQPNLNQMLHGKRFMGLELIKKIAEMMCLPQRELQEIVKIYAEYVASELETARDWGEVSPASTIKEGTINFNSSSPLESVLREKIDVLKERLKLADERTQAAYGVIKERNRQLNEARMEVNQLKKEIGDRSI